jgi:hypothetical protein
MCRLSLTLVVVLTLGVSAQGALLKVDVTYTDGHIESGKLTPDLDVLPGKVQASFTLDGAKVGVYNLDDVVASSLVFGDGAWDVADLESFSATISPGDGAGFVASTLTYAYRAKDSPTTHNRLAANFPLEIEGTDAASGEDFRYQYDTSSQTVTEVPEPPCIALAALGSALLSSAALARRRLFA